VLRRILAPAALTAVALLAIAAGPASATRYVAGAPGAGDPYFPFAGNGGYDARHYSLDIDYDRASNFLDGRTIMVARTTQDLSSFNLDLRRFYAVSRVSVNGRSARFAHEGEHELVITPKKKLKRRSWFVVDVEYSGNPIAVVDPDGSMEGWVQTHDGAFVVNEPQGSPGWFPVNDSPRDKATYNFAITVPEGREAIANGVLTSKRTRNGKTTWRWFEDSPMAPYLATASNGEFELRIGEIDGVPEYNAVDPTTRRSTSPTSTPEPELAWERLTATQPKAVRLFSEIYGPYPFSSVGAIVDYAPNVFYHLESQSKANYWVVPSVTTIVHEVAHQWVGNAVTPETWNDIWLNEGFARWSQWIYDERDGDPATPTAQAAFDAAYATPDTNIAFWNPPPAVPGGPESMFDGTIYTRGGMTLQALRQKIGDPAFFQILKAWYAENKYGNVNTADFIALSERVSGRQLDDFFQVWLYTPGKPAPGSW
jgi:aminopeptidase N